MVGKRKTVRVKRDNYQNGCYFVTVCTKNKYPALGVIDNDVMHLSLLGKTLNDIIIKTPHIRPDTFIEIPIFTIMPNHFHLMIVLNSDNETNQHSFGAQRKNLASIMRGIKSSLTYFARCHQIDFDWQSRFHEHIVRNQREFDEIYQYIENNVLNWKQDCFYHDH